MLKKKTINFIIMLLCFASLLSSAAFAQQTDNGGLAGTVTDPNGAIVPNATVTITNVGTNAKRNLTTNEEGRWTISVLRLGDYEVAAEAAGFQTVKQVVAVVASVTTDVDLILGITSGENIVDVTASERATLVSSDDSATVSSSVSGKGLEAQPLVNRTPFGRLQLDTSSSGDIADPSSNSNGNPEISVNGTRTTSQGVQFNGVDVTNFSGTGSLTENISPAPETVQEVSFLSNLYDASLGRNGGGSIQVVTKSGTNQFNGSAYIYAQNEKFNANDFFFNRDGIDRQKARRVEGGFAIGGPIIKDKFWFFAGYQKTDASTAYVPTAQSFVVLPEALAFITDRSNPENVRQAFLFAARQGGAISSFTTLGCVRTLTPTSSVTDIVGTCIDPTSPRFRLLNLHNPVTGDFFIPTLLPGRYERLFYNSNNVRVLENGVTRIMDFSRFGLPNGLPIIDRAAQNTVRGGFPLVRLRNVFPADFKQDQFTAKLDYNLLKGDNEEKTSTP